MLTLEKFFSSKMSTEILPKFVQRLQLFSFCIFNIFKPIHDRSPRCSLGCFYRWKKSCFLFLKDLDFFIPLFFSRFSNPMVSLIALSQPMKITLFEITILQRKKIVYLLFSLILFLHFTCVWQRRWFWNVWFCNFEMSFLRRRIKVNNQ